MPKKIKRIPIKEFRESGYLQELNRKFLHPLGMALEVIVEDDGTETLGGVWDFRDDPEGMLYKDSDINSKLFKDRAIKIQDEWIKKKINRIKKYGCNIQQVDYYSTKSNDKK